MLLGNEINPPTHSTHTRPSWMCGSGEEEALNPALLSRISLSIMDDDTRMLSCSESYRTPIQVPQGFSGSKSSQARERGTGVAQTRAEAMWMCGYKAT